MPGWRNWRNAGDLKSPTLETLRVRIPLPALTYSESRIMNEHSDPIEFLIEFAWANGADRFVVNNAKDELQKLKENSRKFIVDRYEQITIWNALLSEYKGLFKQNQN